MRRMGAEEDPIVARMQSLSDDELMRVVGVERAEWRPEALEVARAELARRGIVSIPDEAPPAPSGDRRRPYLKAGIPIGIIIALLLEVLSHLFSR